MVIAVLYPPCSQAGRIPSVAQSFITSPAASATATEAQANTSEPKEKKEKKKKKQKKSKKDKKSVALPEGAIGSLQQLQGKLAGCTRFAATVRYDVNLPMSSDDIVYDLSLASVEAKGDTLFPADYLIDWKLNCNGNSSDGFLAYFSGNHYRYRDYRLQEYHYDWDRLPFETSYGGVQANGQFVDLLPQSIDRRINTFLSDSTYRVHFTPDTLVGSEHRVALTAVQRVNGQTGHRCELIADRFTGMPVSLKNEYNPGELSEQSTTARYGYANLPDNLQAPLTEAQLQAMYPDVFAKYRETGNRIEHLRGLPMPGFSLPTTTGERYSRHKGDPFQASAVIAIIDPEADSASATVSGLRKAVSDSMTDAVLILAFTGSDTDRIDEIAGTSSEKESLLISARSLARDCGTEVFPTVIVADRWGKVTDVILGVNRNMVSSVIESLTRLK